MPGWARAGRSTTSRPRTGPLSYAVRWHGDRPALLWDLVAEPGVHRRASPSRDWTRRGPPPSRGARRCSDPSPSPRRHRRTASPRRSSSVLGRRACDRASRRRPTACRATRSSPSSAPSGVPDDEIERAEADGNLVLLAIDHLALGPGPPLRPRPGVRADGPARGRAPPHLAVARLPRSRAGRSHLLRGRLATTCAAVADLLHSGAVSPEVAYGMTRVLGSSMARIASALVDAVSARAEQVMRAGGDGDDVVALEPLATQAGGFLPMFPAVLEQVWRRHLQAAARRRLLRSEARGGGRHRRRVRRPRGLHRARPAGERRGAGRGRRPVRAARLRRRRRRRRSGAQDDRRRGHVPRRRPGGRRRDRPRPGRRLPRRGRALRRPGGPGLRAGARAGGRRLRRRP